MSKIEIISKIEESIPSAKRFIRSSIDNILLSMSKKVTGERKINYYPAKKYYCLPYETRAHLTETRINDEILKNEVSENFTRKLINSDILKEATSDEIEKITASIHRTLEKAFERQGYQVVYHFSCYEDGESGLDAKSISDLLDDEISESDISDNYKIKAKQAALLVIRDVFYSSSKIEREYCGKLSRTYVLLFIIKKTPEVIEYFNNMAKSFRLYVGSDLIVRSISEFFLPEEDRMTTNLLKILIKSGSELVLTEATLGEVHSHIYAADREYINNYANIDNYITRYLASQSSKILIRAYFYAKFDKAKNYPRSWENYLENFLPYKKLKSQLSPESLSQLKTFLCSLYDLSYESDLETRRDLDSENIFILKDKIIKTKDQKDSIEIIAENDALHILKVDKIRDEERRKISNPYGYRTWWLTQKTKSGYASYEVFPKWKDRKNKIIMNPEFLINYISYSPKDSDIRNSLNNIFPSLLGIQLGSKLDSHVYDKVLQRIKYIERLHPSRVEAIINDYSNSLQRGDISFLEQGSDINF